MLSLSNYDVTSKGIVIHKGDHAKTPTYHTAEAISLSVLLCHLKSALGRIKAVHFPWQWHGESKFTISIRE